MTIVSLGLIKFTAILEVNLATSGLPWWATAATMLCAVSAEPSGMQSPYLGMLGLMYCWDAMLDQLPNNVIVASGTLDWLAKVAAPIRKL